MAAIGRVRLPATFEPHSAGLPPRRRQAPRSGRAAPAAPGRAGRHAPARGGGRRGVHPVELDPDLRDRMRAAGQAERLERELGDLARRVDGHQGSLGREFDRVVDVLARRGYIDLGGDEAPGWALTTSGEMLANIFHECDLLVAECLRLGWLDGVEAPVLAGLLSTFVYEHRSPDPPAPPWFPNAAARERWRLVAATSEDLAAGERAGGLAPHRPPDAGFFGAAHGWTAGHDLEAVVDRRRADRRRLRPLDEAGDRPRPPGGRRGAGRGHPRRRPQGRPQRVPRHRRRRHRGRAARPTRRDDSSRSRRGASRPPRPTTRWWCVATSTWPTRWPGASLARCWSAAATSTPRSARRRDRRPPASPST